MRKITVIFIAACVVFDLVLVSCGGDKKASKETDREKFAKKLESGEYADLTILQKAAEKEIESFSFSLKKALSEAMHDGGPINAINVCSELAPEIAMAHSTEGWTISRISEKSRNRNNRADNMQLEILDEFYSPDQEPKYVGEWQMLSGKKTYFYYKPIYVQEICLNCHGARENIKPEVAAKIKELYPEDAATGYRVGDLRGMFVVKVAWPEGRARAEALAADSID